MLVYKLIFNTYMTLFPHKSFLFVRLLSCLVVLTAFSVNSRDLCLTFDIIAAYACAFATSSNEFAKMADCTTGSHSKVICRDNRPNIVVSVYKIYIICKSTAACITQNIIIISLYNKFTVNLNCFAFIYEK